MKLKFVSSRKNMIANLKGAITLLEKMETNEIAISTEVDDQFFDIVESENTVIHFSEQE